MRRIIFVFALLLFAGAARAADPGEITLAMRFTKGDLFVYALHLNANIDSMVTGGAQVPRMSFNMEMHMEMRVVDVSATGTADVDMRFTDARMTVNDNPVGEAGDLMKNPLFAGLAGKMRMRIERGGKVEFPEGLPGIAASQMRLGDLMGSMDSALPRKPLRIGDTWEQPLDLSILAGGDKGKTSVSPIKVKYRLAGMETMKKIQCAHIEMNYSGDMGNLTDELVKAQSPAMASSAARFEKMLQDFHGDMYFAPEKGLFVGFEFEMTQDSTIRVPRPAGSNGDATTVDQRMRMKGTLEME